MAVMISLRGNLALRELHCRLSCVLELAPVVNREIDPANLPQRIAADPMHGAVTALVALQGAWDTMVMSLSRQHAATADAIDGLVELRLVLGDQPSVPV